MSLLNEVYRRKTIPIACYEKQTKIMVENREAVYRLAIMEQAT
jgi:hypothetical protein